MAWKLNESALTDTLELANPPVTTVPLTWATWVRFAPAQLGQSCAIVYLGNSSNNDRFLIGKSGTDVFQMFVNLTGLNTIVSQVTVNANTWYHVCGVWASTTSWSLYINGAVDSFYSGGAVTPSGVNRLSIGSRYSNGSSGLNVRGIVAHSGLWSATLGASEIQRLALGARPDEVRARSLVEYWPLTRRRPQQGIRASRNLSVQGSPQLIDGLAVLEESRGRVLRAVPWLAAASMPPPPDPVLTGGGGLSDGIFSPGRPALGMRAFG